MTTSQGKQNLNPRQANPKPITSTPMAANPQKFTKKCQVDVTVGPISSNPRTKVHNPTTYPHQQKNLNHPATAKTHNLPPIKTHPTTVGFVEDQALFEIIRQA